MVKLIVAILFVAWAAAGHAKVFDRCELVRLLRTKGMPGSLSTWICIAYHESRYNTDALSKTGDHGIFQINEGYWCTKTGPAGKGCKARCSDFHNNDISDDINCAKTVYKDRQRRSKSGYEAWSTYKFCKGDTSKYVAGC